MDREGYDRDLIFDNDRDWIEKRIAALRRQGTDIFINGRVLSWKSIRQIEITETDKTSQEIVLAYNQAGRGFNWSYNFGNV